MKGFEVTLQLTALTHRSASSARRCRSGVGEAKLPRYISIAVIEVVRGTPILMLIFWIYFLLPQVIGTAVSAYVAGLVALITFNAAYSAEIIQLEFSRSTVAISKQAARQG